MTKQRGHAPSFFIPFATPNGLLFGTSLIPIAAAILLSALHPSSARSAAKRRSAAETSTASKIGPEPSSAGDRRPQDPAAPLLRDLIGLNVHTVQFKHEQFTPVTRLVRDYHGVEWDVGDDTTYAPPFPFARNQVNWDDLYGRWRQSGYDVHASLMIDTLRPEAWKNPELDAYSYGFLFARHFGPSGARYRVSSVEIGNEPGDYSDELYKILFRNAAQAIRKADPKMKIATCAIDAAPSGKYHKSLQLFRDMEPLYDIINLHTYAELEGWPTWRRSYPEDPALSYLTKIRQVIDWRDRNARGKPVWITEFGWDSTTQPQEKEGDFKQWVGVTDLQQAQYLVRSLLIFSSMQVDRAYIYWFNDEDRPSVHASSGLTRKGVPKPSFHAVAHLSRVLGNYRFRRIVARRPGDVYLYEYGHASDPRRLARVAWSPTGNDRKTSFSLADLPGKPARAERMAVSDREPEAVPLADSGGTGRIEVNESPLYLFTREDG